jgi:uncharacterized protein (TIGR00288 family)
MQQERKFAVLIDGDNIPASYLKEMMEEITKYGNPTIKRIYGDWTNPQLKSWKNRLLSNAIRPIQQYAYTSGKNATDSAMIIDAMDILYSDKVDGFCIVSSDSDFTRLATRLREAGKHVIGIGERKTPEPFIVACDKFIYVEILKPSTQDNDKETNPKPTKTEKISKKSIRLLTNSIEDVADEEGWAFLGDVGTILLKKQPNFDARNYGFQKLTALISSLNKFEIELRDAGKGRRSKLVYVRVKS